MATACPTAGGFSQLSSLALALAEAAGVETQGLQPIPVTPPYAKKFSNGPVLPEITAELLGATLVNFSFGGAQALGELPFIAIAGSVIPDEVQAAIDALPPEVAGRSKRCWITTSICRARSLPSSQRRPTGHPPSPDSALVSLIGLNDLRGLLATYDPANPSALIADARPSPGRSLQAQA